MLLRENAHSNDITLKKLISILESAHNDRECEYTTLKRRFSALKAHINRVVTDPNIRIDQLEERIKALENCIDPDNSYSLEKINNNITSLNRMCEIIKKKERTKISPQWIRIDCEVRKILENAEKIIRQYIKINKNETINSLERFLPKRELEIIEIISQINAFNSDYIPLALNEKIKNFIFDIEYDY